MTAMDNRVVHQRWGGRTHRTQLPTSQSPVMPTQTQFDPVAATLKLLAFWTLIIADSKASPIPAQMIRTRGTGITSSEENLMTTKVRKSQPLHPRNPI